MNESTARDGWEWNVTAMGETRLRTPPVQMWRGEEKQKRENIDKDEIFTFAQVNKVSTYWWLNNNIVKETIRYKYTLTGWSHAT